jgi:phenylalanyl-tRNA synthetase alpha chain
LRRQALNDVSTASSTDAVERLRVQYLGKHGRVAEAFSGLGKRSLDDRKRFGAAINRIKSEVGSALDERLQVVLDLEPALTIPLDVTIPGRAPAMGALHPTTQMMQDLNDAFLSLNFEVFEGPEISSELYEFDYMNFPPNHPARETMDTYWLDGYENLSNVRRLCLRPHLTGASVRYMQRRRPPFRIVYPGRVYRNESTDASHERAFFQYEALIVDRDVPFTSGRLLINTILRTVFGRPVETRMRAGFFPFVEPGFEIDMRCLSCSGSGCRVCRQVGWLEVMPGGVPHPNVLRAGGIDPDEWMGFYINVGLDRLVMMRYGIDDVRVFHQADLRFLSQFK